MKETTLNFVKIFTVDKAAAKKLHEALTKLGVIPVLPGNTQLKAFTFEGIPIQTPEGVAELIRSTPGILNSRISYSLVSQEGAAEGDGSIHQHNTFAEFRVILSDGKNLADITKPTLAAAVTEAFAGIKKTIPEAIVKALLP